MSVLQDGGCVWQLNYSAKIYSFAKSRIDR